MTTRSVGRPTKYDPAYCDQIIAHMATGASMTSFAAEISVARSTINVWIADFPEFKEAVGIGKAKCAAWWEKINRKVAETGIGNAQACKTGLMNMAPEDWTEVQKIEHSGGMAITVSHEDAAL